MDRAPSIRTLTTAGLGVRFDPAAAGIWVLAFALPLYLALKGGGYDTVVRGQIGIAVWWVILVGSVVGVLPLARPTRAAWGMVALLAAFAAWSLVSTAWSASSERGMIETSRVVAHLGVLLLAVLVTRRGSGRTVLNALAAAIGVIGTLALLSRLHPGWFPASQTAEFLPSAASRLAYPLNYWNAVGALLALGLPLLLVVAASTRSRIGGALAAGVVPLCCSALFLTYSRAALLALAVALVVLLVVHPRRLHLGASLAVAAVGSAVLVLNIAKRDALADGRLSELALRQGDQLIWIGALVAIGTALMHVAMVLVGRHVQRPRVLQWSPRATAVFFGVMVLTLVVLAIAVGGADRASDQWQSFKQSAGGGTTAERLTTLSGNGRYQYWTAAVDAARLHPATGLGAGNFEFWWAEHATIGGFIRNAHSLWIETLAELGYIGLALIVALFALPLAVGTARLRRLSVQERAVSAAALAALGAFCVSATFDWVWQVTVLPIVALVLGAVLLRPVRPPDERTAGATDVVRRVVTVVASLGAIVVIVLPLAGVISIRDSQSEARRADVDSALRHASVAERVQPYAATPLLQQALVLEQSGDLAAAAGVARRATVAERDNWRTWLVLSRIEAQRGRPAASVAAYREARRLNPKSSLFTR